MISSTIQSRVWFRNRIIQCEINVRNCVLQRSIWKWFILQTQTCFLLLISSWPHSHSSVGRDIALMFFSTSSHSNIPLRWSMPLKILRNKTSEAERSHERLWDRNTCKYHHTRKLSVMCVCGERDVTYLTVGSEDNVLRAEEIPYQTHG